MAKNSARNRVNAATVKRINRNGKATLPSGGTITGGMADAGQPKVEGLSADVSYVRPEVTDLMPKWEKISDCLKGEDAVKSKGVKYLPMPRVDDDPVENQTRYDVYKERAVWYNATARTLDGMTGQVFSRDPVRQLPPQIEKYVEDIDGAGSSLDQVAKLTLGATMAMGRAGLLADYPPTIGPVTIAQQQLGLVRPIMMFIDPTAIINWRTQLVGSRRMLTLVVIYENMQQVDNGFETSYVQQWRVLRLLETGYQIEIWRRETPEDPFVLYDTYYPTDGNGEPFMEIPFTFVGPTNNNEYPDKPPLYDLATLNIAHYRNSADYEEACFITGQPTAYFTGLTQQWVEDVFKNKVYLGSRAIIPLPQGATAGLLQVTANSMPFEAMDHKERLMVSLGANLIQKTGAQRTLGEAQQDAASEASILSAATKNVSMAVQKVLRWCVQFETGIKNDQSVTFDLNTDFPASRLTPNERAELVLEWQAGAIGYPEMRNGLRRAGIATLPDVEAEALGKQKLQDDNAMQAKLKAQMSANSGGTNDPKLNQGNGGGNQAGS